MPSPDSSKNDSTPPTLQEIFGPGGLLERCHPGYEFRPSQLAMAQMVEQAFEKRRHLVVEAGTGTGKTLAYLVPAIRSGRTVVISTATKSLQEQLFQKDIPFLQSRLSPDLKVAVMKGRGNFLCRQKLYQLGQRPLLKDLDEVDWLERIRQWESRTGTGDRAELDFLPDDAGLWPRLDARRDTCSGQKCPEFGRCFITWMHQRAREADLVIVNHHLFFADLAIRQDDFGSILPEYSAVIFDEAHEIEDVASDYFGRRISNYRFEDLARDCEQAVRLGAGGSPELLHSVAKVRERAREWFACFPDAEGRFPFGTEAREQFLERNREAYDGLAGAMRHIEAELAAVKGRPEDLLAAARRAAALRGELAFLAETDQRGFVYWYERRGKGMFLAATPIDVSAILRGKLFETFDTVVLTSATLAVGGNFDYFKQRLGIDGAGESVLAHEFDYRSQAVLYVPPNLPDVRDPCFAARAADEIEQVLEVTQGRAFCLFTSYAQMREVYERLSDRLDYPLLLQGKAPRSALLDRFRNTPGAVLFATSTFWQGVDVPGEQLSCVIVDRLPFAVPSDPVVAARVRALAEDGRNAFVEYQVPEAVLALKQGFGRLVRSRGDRGVLVILDNRIRRKSYGRIFLESLPDYTISESLADVKQFMADRPSKRVGTDVNGRSGICDV
ncbi:MAG TPA: ATP-dependent DNA helicase [Candidatus Dormibacteraeota bacterium]|nr:ATP-dependent DNA helicase [Candidatus Dormibacteraeota bacterium]